MESAVATRTATWRVICGETEGTVTILLTCRKKQMSIVLSTACQMGATDDERNVGYRVDDEDPVTKSFSIPRNKNALVLTDHTDSIEFVKSLFGKDRLDVTLRPSDHDPFSATFKISGLEKEVSPLRKKCDW